MLDQTLWNKISMDVPQSSFSHNSWRKEKEEVEVQLSLIKWFSMNKQVNNLETRNTQLSDMIVLKESWCQLLDNRSNKFVWDNGMEAMLTLNNICHQLDSRETNKCSNKCSCARRNNKKELHNTKNWNSSNKLKLLKDNKMNWKLN